MEFQNSRLERILSWSFILLTFYVSFYLTLTHYAEEGLLLSILITHLGIYTAFRRVLHRYSYAVLAFSHVLICYWIGKNALEVLSAIDKWKQGF
ncbi:hypothetical protein ACE5IS_09900 [Leptospira wolffii]|uniref:Uncharacterized protein n=1 Tax=Leptospira wolffii TaxID=409998 RepID=A0A2M9ZEC8_9LEPT|nr:hypothetical protein [Leptospira wolffii]EPG65222.1 hypothetical protein LEP1GSC061_2587 [Leptospira wolffii serovar Khorat str. Khorat-H2]PJZ66677.1 hypothetical protein CH371_00785 [Leptospira wolffii]TGK61652.1 hypothetical protein EHQ32_02005 [Leptospira wolffii]TGK70196.1 hypothetical protein EHQ35_17420 [Leptospira wolffii]TGK77119.1 hypothetical protein EHQ27_03870 [Leptospira wolffii]